MKFKKGDRVEYIGESILGFTVGKIYTVRENELSKYGNLTIELDDNGSKTNGLLPKYFKLIEENKMKTDKKTMASIYRKMADNVERGIDAHSGIQFYCSIDKKWIDKYGTDTYKNILYRIKPETTTLKNGVTIPKPLPRNEMKRNIYYYVPSTFKCLWEMTHTKDIHNRIDCFIYSTKEEAIEASKALFGIE